MTVKRLLLVLVVALALCACTPAQRRLFAQQQRATVTSAEAKVIARVNAVRAQHGLHALAPLPALTKKARWWSGQMAAHRCPGTWDGGPPICHSVLVEQLSVGLPAGWQWVGENVGACACSNALVVELAFENSPHHLANILHAGARYIGVGTATWGSHMYVTEEFMQ